MNKQRVVNKLRIEFVLIICLSGCLQVQPASACMYNVREIGFVDLAIRPYHFYAYVSEDLPAEIITTIEQVSFSALKDSNIKFELIKIGQRKKLSAMKYINMLRISSFPAFVLVSPDGLSLPIPVMEANRPFKEVFSTALADIVSSVKRREILEKVSKTYGVVLLMEGRDAEQNKRAKQIISAAVKRVTARMDKMPKPISQSPEIVVLDFKRLTEEKILLWSLGLEAREIVTPHAVVLYGRGRWLGPMFEGDGITENNIADVLFVIGADCECGFDQRWLQGTMLPLKWDGNLQVQTAEVLGFDPENPMIKTEISRIVRKGYRYYRQEPGANQRAFAQAQQQDRVWQTVPAQAENAVSPVPAVGSFSEQFPLAVNEPVLQRPLCLIAGLMILTVGIGLLIALRGTRRN